MGALSIRVTCSWSPWAANPVQTGVGSGTIAARRAAVVRGQVRNRDAAPLPGVTVTVLSHPEFGETVTRADGLFDLAVNGGGWLTIRYDLAGHIPVQRRIHVPWQDYAWAPEVTMTPYDNGVTAVDLSSPGPMRVARGSVVSDADGARRATLLFPEGTAASMSLPGGGTQSLSTLHVRATEYTAGPNGPASMPAPLPPTSGYTYAVELSVDEAVAAGADNVVFDRLLPVYVENFLDFPVGMIVPVGHYDKTLGAWVPSQNGRVVKVLGLTGGLAELDTDGEGLADDQATLSALGVTDAERQQLAGLYLPGQSVWRVPIGHFSTVDMNAPYACSGDCTRAVPPPFPPKGCGEITVSASVIECQTQTLRESAAVAGTSFTVNYGSDRTPGRKDAYTLAIPLCGAVVPQGLKRIELEIGVAGRLFSYGFDNSANQTFTFTWDGMDTYARVLQGAQRATIRVGYVYDALYTFPAQTDPSFGLPGATPIPGVPPRIETVLWQSWERMIGTWDARGQGLGGWTLSVHHAFDPVERTVYLGTGEKRGGLDAGRVIRTVAGNGDYDSDSGDGGPAKEASLMFPRYVAVGPDDILYISEDVGCRIRRVGPDGIITTLAGDGNPGYGGDNGPASLASLKWPAGVAAGPDGSLYIADYGNNRVRRVGTDNIITTVAGTGTPAFGGDGGPAAQAGLNAPLGVALGPDGSLYIADSGNHRIRRVEPAGVITTVAGNGGDYYGGDGGPALLAALKYPMSVAVGPDGNLYIGDYNVVNGDWAGGVVRRVGPDGIISRIAGNGLESSYCGDGGPAQNACLELWDLAVGPDATLYIAGSNRIRRVGPDGVITTLAGNGTIILADGGPAAQAGIYFASGVAVGPDQAIYVADDYHARIRRISPPLPGYSGHDILLPSGDGTELFHVSGDGRHLETLNARTGTDVYRFEYGNAGLVVRVVDADNNATVIERDPDGDPVAIVSPGGQRTSLSCDPNGYLVSVAGPAGDNVTLAPRADGLLDHMIDPRGYLHRFAYDGLGRLIRDDDPAGGFKGLTRIENGAGNGYVVDVATALGRVSSYGSQRSYYDRGGASGAPPIMVPGTLSTRTLPSGAQTSTFLGDDGITTSWSPDNTVTEARLGGDGASALTQPFPVLTRTWTPGDLFLETTTSRTTLFADPDNPLSLLSQSETTTVNERAYTTVYDNATRQTTTTTPAGRQTVSTTDEKGRVVSVRSDPNVFPVTFSYDDKGRLFQTGQDNNLWTNVYDNGNRLFKKIDPMDNTTEYGYDAADRVNLVKLPSGRTYRFEYDRGGNRTKVIMPNDNVHVLGYSPVNLDNSYAPPDSLSYSHGYSLDREWTQTVLPSGRTIDAAYNNARRLSTIFYPEASISYTYNDGTERVFALARTDLLDNTTQTILYDYDGALTTRLSFAGSTSGEYRYSYDNNFWITGIAFDNATLPVDRDPDGLLTGYGPFTFSRGGPAGAQDNVTDLIPRTCGVDNTGLPVSCPTGTLRQTYGYDPFGRMNRRTQTVNGMPVYEEVLERDKAGKIVRKTETVAGTAHTFDYLYDPDGQLIDVYKDGALVEHYTYDNNANRTSTMSATATYDSQDRLVTHGNVTYQFDPDGFLSVRGNDRFVYSSRGELLFAAVGGQTVTYHYDGTNRRVGKTDASGTVQNLYGNQGNPFQVTATRHSTDNVLTSYFYDEAGALFAFERSGQRYYVGSDHLGTPKVVTDNAGAIIRQVDYDSWGAKMSDTNAGFDLPIGFAGGIPDDASGMVRFGFRDYEPGTGRWAAKDPIFFRGGQWNIYAYVGNSPMGRKDKSGLGPPSECSVYAECCNNLGDYCCTALYYCQKAGDSPCANCIRNCLIDVGCFTWKDAIPAHVACFLSCKDICTDH